MPAHRERDLAAGFMNFLGELHAGSRRADDQHATLRQPARIAVGGWRELANAGRELGCHRRNAEIQRHLDARPYLAA
jgi:hypothetical protein